MNPKKAVRRVIPKSVVRPIEKGYRGGRSQYWQARYGYPAKSLKMIAITGTNGKTTTSSYVNSVLKAAGLKTAVYTTAFFEIAGEVTPNHTHMTVTSQASVQRFFAQARDAGVDWVIMEVTSMALHQGRVGGLKPEIGIVTNLTQDHLDYHKTMEKYATAKALLFTKYHAKHAILNGDDQWYDFFHKRAGDDQRSVGSSQTSDLHFEDLECSAQGSTFKITINGKIHQFRTNLLGVFNVYNALCAIAVGQKLGLSTSDIQKGVAALKAVPGRMEQIEAGQNFAVLVDFAYTPDALENALLTLRPLTKGKLRIVFGATGDRDKSKRPKMGEVVARHADVIYLTDDETYTEDPESIRQAVFEGIVSVGGKQKTRIIEDRLKAIELAFSESKTGDTVLLTGIGHENYRNMGGKKVAWDEREVARKLLRKIEKG